MMIGNARIRSLPRWFWKSRSQSASPVQFRIRGCLTIDKISSKSNDQLSYSPLWDPRVRSEDRKSALRGMLVLSTYRYDTQAHNIPNRKLLQTAKNALVTSMQRSRWRLTNFNLASNDISISNFSKYFEAFPFDTQGAIMDGNRPKSLTVPRRGTMFGCLSRLQISSSWLRR